MCLPTHRDLFIYFYSLNFSTYYNIKQRKNDTQCTFQDLASLFSNRNRAKVKIGRRKEPFLSCSDSHTCTHTAVSFLLCTPCLIFLTSNDNLLRAFSTRKFTLKPPSAYLQYTSLQMWSSTLNSCF